MKSLLRFWFLLAATALFVVACGEKPAEEPAEPSGKEEPASAKPAEEAAAEKPAAEKPAAPTPAPEAKAEEKPAAAKAEKPAPKAEEPKMAEKPAPARAPEPAPAKPAEKKKEEPAVAASSGNTGGDWPEWGRDDTNNMMSPADGIPSDFTAGEEGDNGEIDLKTANKADWIAKLGSQSYGTPTISGGRVLVGTNNEEPRDPNVTGDHGIVLCLDEQSGEMMWQFVVPKLGAGKVSDWEYLGVCSSTNQDGKFGYVVTNRCEIVCLDLYGMEDGNDGPFDQEAKYKNGGIEGLAGAQPGEIGAQDADIVWGYDMRGELGVFPHNVTSSSVVLADGKVFATTSNGVDWSHINIPAPQAPCFIALDQKTGELVGEEGSGIGTRIMHCNWSTPAFAENLAGTPTVIFGAGDGYCYGFGTKAEKDADGFDILPELWKVNCCPDEYRFDEQGNPIKYATYPGPSEIIASPVVYNDKVYVAIGQDPEHGEGVGALTCIDPSKGGGDESIVWQFKDIGRTISTPSIVDGVLYISDYSGRVFCLNPETGEKYWEYDTLSHIWGSTLVVDGKIFIGNEDGELVVLPAGKDADKNGDGELKSKDGEVLNIIEFPSSIYSTPVIANGAIYILTQTHLYKFSNKGGGVAMK